MGKVLSLLLGKKKNWSTADLVNAISKPIKLEPGVFDEEDIKWSKKGADPEAVREYLKPQDGNQAACFKVGVAFVGGADDGSLRLGHAEIVIQEYTRPAGVEKATAANPLRAADPPVVQGNGDKRMRLPEANLILIHICFPPGDQSELRLVYKEDRRALVYYRYVEMLSIYTTKRTLKHLALKACPERHSMVVSDCASVARSFIAGLFDVLGDSPALRENLKQLLKTIHVEDGWVGESEDSSRQELELSAKLERSL